MEDKAQAIERRHRIAANYLEIKRWVTSTIGECECPAGHQGAWLYIDGRPFIHCFHNSCRSDCLDASAKLADEFGDDGCSTPENDAEIKRLRAWRKELRSFESTARHRMLPGILDEPDVPLSYWMETSPVPIPEFGTEQWKLLLASMFPRVSPFGDYRIWLGDLADSGSPFNTVNFKTLDEWLDTKLPYGDQLSVCQWRPFDGDKIIYRRVKANILTTEYMVLESDTLTKGQFGNVIKFVSKTSTLRAVVSTGGKSMHAWFDRPALKRVASLYDTKEWQEIRNLIFLKDKGGNITSESDPTCFTDLERRNRFYYLNDVALPKVRKKLEDEAAEFIKNHERAFSVLAGLGCDRAMLKNPISTTRLPGVDRVKDGDVIGQQRLLFLNPRYNYE